jgi:hypothetical protein
MPTGGARSMHYASWSLLFDEATASIAETSPDMVQDHRCAIESGVVGEHA